MKRQFLRQHHAREDKAQKPDYREEMALEDFVRSGSDTASTLRDELACKGQLIKRYQEGLYWWGGYHISPEWSLQQFASHNKRSGDLPETLQAFETLKKIAQLDFETIRDGIRRGCVKWSYDCDGDPVPSVSFSVRIVSENVMRSGASNRVLQ